MSEPDHRRARPATERTGLKVTHVLPWVPPLVGVCLLTVVLVVTGLRLAAGGNSRTGLLPLPPLPQTLANPGPSVPPSGDGAWPDAPIPAGPDQSGARPSSAGSALAGSGPAGGSPTRADTALPAPHPTTPAGNRPTTTTATHATPLVTGRYQVLNSYRDAFIAEVLIENQSGDSHDWTAQLEFPSTVTTLFTSWVESAPQATLTRAGAAYRWTSGVPVPAHASVALRFHFQRSGTGNVPVSCTVNGTACTGTGSGL